MTVGNLILITISLILAAFSISSTMLMLYAWEEPQKRLRNRVPTSFDPAHYSFTVLLPARHEEAVIQETIQRVVELNYPPELVQILVIIEAGDLGTIAKVNEKIKALRQSGVGRVELLTFTDPPINKPHGLNVGLRSATNDVVVIFDAEDEPHPDILHVVNTTMLRENAPVIQCGVQLMNYADRWFSALNVLEYFFWFKSRLHFHSTVGMIPLGGNTIFMTRELLVKLGGWDQYCLTEDADIGVRLSTLNIPIRVLYDDAYVTKEETPDSVNQFIKQRTRWNQGFLQVLMKGDWRNLPSTGQKLLALYTLAFPVIQALTAVYIFFSLWMIVFIKASAATAIISSLPLYLLFFQYLISVIGLYEFTSVHKLRPSWLAPLKMLVAFVPFQLLLSYASLRACWRHVRGMNNWEKTRHIGAHRQGHMIAPVNSHRVAPVPLQLEEEEALHG